MYWNIWSAACPWDTADCGSCCPPSWAVALGRYRVWASAESPLPTLLFVPGLPALLGFLGLLAGWLAWRRMWLPRVVRNKQSE